MQAVVRFIVDSQNHGWDAIRYSLYGYIQASWAAPTP